MTIPNDVKVKKVNHDTQESVGATQELCYAPCVPCSSNQGSDRPHWSTQGNF